MADVKAQELGYEEWRELLEPYGWAEITRRSAVAPRGVSLGVVAYEFRLMLRGDLDGALDEWAHRSCLLDQARQAVQAVKAKGYVFLDAPRIEFAGQYRYRVDRGAEPEWYAEARLEFGVGAR